MKLARHFIARHRFLALCLIGAAMLVKLLVPAGFMPVASNGAIAVQLCTGQGPQMIMLELPGQTDDHDYREHMKTEMPCAFSGLSSPTLAGADPIQLALAIGFIVAMVFRRLARPVLWRGLYLRPPAIGPPQSI